MNKLIFLAIAIALLLLIVPLTHVNATTTKVSPAADKCVRDMILSYGLLVGSGSDVKETLDNTTAIIEERCLQK
jgi:hypothetical protein